jgi:hypothetical protein
MIMAGKWMVFDEAFNEDGASASSSPIWMIGMGQHSWGFEDGFCP